MSDDLWGPWIEHDGNGCPCVGQWVIAHGVYPSGSTRQQEGIVRDTWSWNDENFGTPHPRGGVTGRIVRYRIRKPRGLTILKKLIENLPAPVCERDNA